MVVPVTVVPAQGAKVAVVCACGEEIGEREGVEDGGGDVVVASGGQEVFAQGRETTTQASRRAGARVLLTEPKWTTASGARGWTALTMRRS